MSNHDQDPAAFGAGARTPITPEIVDPDVVEPPAGASDSAEPGQEDGPPLELTVEDLIDQLERVTRERDGHFDARARLQAEFDNYRKRIAHQHTDLVERAAEALVGKLLPVLDACDAAVALAVAGAEPIAAQLVAVLEKEGLARIDALEQPFDPEVHEAVIHEPADTDTDADTDVANPAHGPKVVDVLRTGYQWRSRVIRPAMVKVRG
ncbi:MAG: nucleotide exchange factor GrpE [Acidimicrobiales bacterium]